MLVLRGVSKEGNQWLFEYSTNFDMLSLFFNENYLTKVILSFNILIHI